MINLISKYIAVFFTSAVKFIAGPVLGIGAGLSFMETCIFTSLGMMASVLVFSSLAGNIFKSWFQRTFYKNQKLFSKRNRRLIRIWKSFGIKGVAFLTPILLSPIGGTLLAASFGESKKNIFFYMLASSVFWSFVFSLGLFAIRNGNWLASLTHR